MRRELAAIYDELVRRQQEGEKSVYLSAGSLELLRKAAAEAAPKAARGAEPPPAPRAPAAPVAPEPAVSTPEMVAEVFQPAAPAPARKPKAPPAAPIAVPPAPQVVLPAGDKAVRWQALREQVLNDPWCRSQVKPGKQVVFGVGSLDARIFFCGEAPGADEEVVGEPFVGAAGQLLTKIIETMGLRRGDVYIGNIMNYRPPLDTPVGNRPPTREEMAYCLPYLLAQLEIVQPGAIVALGNTAIEGLLGHDPKRRIGQIRGKWMEFRGIPLIPTYHPSYLLRNEGNASKRQVWEDMLAVMDRLGMPVSDRQRGYFQKL